MGHRRWASRQGERGLRGGGAWRGRAVDGAGITGAEELCRHGTAWYARRLGTTILARLSLDPSDLLTDAVGRSIDDVTGLHRDTCRVTDPSSPCATVAAVRVAGGRVDHLLLGDSVVVLHVRDGPPYIVEDRREPEIARPLWEALVGLEPGTAEHEQALDHARGTFRASRNQPGRVLGGQGRRPSSRRGARPAATLRSSSAAWPS